MIYRFQTVVIKCSMDALPADDLQFTWRSSFINTRIIEIIRSRIILHDHQNNLDCQHHHQIYIISTSCSHHATASS